MEVVYSIGQENKGKVNNANEMKEREKYAIDVAKGMAFLHSTTPPIIHRDLKSPNILLKKVQNSPYFVAKIADFGLSRGLVWGVNDFEGREVDNPVWLAPEILRNQPYSEKVDVYAFGIISWELICGRDFMGHESFLAKIEDRIKKGEREEIPTDNFIPDYYKYVITICWDENPEKRPSFEQVKQKLMEHNSSAGGLDAEPSKLTLSYDSLLNLPENKNNGFTITNNNNNDDTQNNNNELILTDLPQDVGPITFSLGTRGRGKIRGVTRTTMTVGSRQNNNTNL